MRVGHSKNSELIVFVKYEILFNLPHMDDSLKKIFFFVTFRIMGLEDLCYKV